MVDERNQTIVWRLSYDGIPSAVRQAHIHFGRRGTFGGIVAFLCTNLGNAPVKACPLSSGTISHYPGGEIRGQINLHPLR